MPFDVSKKTFESLHSVPTSNFTVWQANFEAAAKLHGVWRSIQGRLIEPEFADPNAPTAAETKEHDEWEDKQEQAAAMLWLCIDLDQQTQVRGIRHDGTRMYEKLEELHRPQDASPRFTALTNLLNVSIGDEEALIPLLTRVRKLGDEWRAVLPHTLSLNQLVNEIQCIAAIRAISQSHDNVASRLLQEDKLSLETVYSAFFKEDNRPVTAGASTTTAGALRAMRTTTYTPSLTSPSTSPPSSSSSTDWCDFCEISGHNDGNCFTKKNALKKAKQKVLERRSKKETKTESASLARVVI